MAENPWIPGNSSSLPPEDGKDRDEQSPPTTADTESMPGAGASYADKFLAARTSPVQAAPEVADQTSADFTETPLPSGSAGKPQPATSNSQSSQAPDQDEPSRDKPETDQSRKPQTETSAPVAKPADKNCELLRALRDKREQSPNAKLGKFPRKRERHAVANLRELSLVEGNLMGLGAAVRTLYFTSCFAGEGKTTALLEAAYGLAIHGSSTTLLIDGNSDNPCLHGEFGMPNRTGFRDVLRGAAALHEAIHPTAHENLFVLPCGNGKATLNTTALETVLQTLADNFDFVLIDGKPLLSSSEVSATAPKLDAVLLVVECEKTKWEVVQLAQDKLATVDVKNTGIVLNRRRFYIPKPIYRLMSR